ncbi:MAG: YeeE/YedE family protein, partial [Alphaproteobacteria bacterium]|nr:YeeE/YedE family protein [Alphaproteobacteria bacterium]
LMGFGGMLAGGCAIGSLTGASVFAATAWLALLSMWIGAGLTDLLVDQRGSSGQAITV